MKIKIDDLRLIHTNKGSCWDAYIDRCMIFCKVRSIQNESDDLTGFRFIKYAK